MPTNEISRNLFHRNGLARMLFRVPTLGENVKAHRLRLERDRRWLSNEIGVKEGSTVVADIENDRYDVGLSKILRVAKALGVPLDDLLAGTDPTYDAVLARTQADRPVVVKHPPSPERGGANAPARTEARVLELEAELANVRSLLTRLISTARTAARDMERTKARLEGKAAARRKA